MGKIGIALAITAWVLMGVRIIGGEMKSNNDIVEAFERVEYLHVDTIIDASGDIEHISIKDKKSLAARIAAGLGIDNTLVEKKSQKNNAKIYSYVKDNQNVSIKINITTVENGVENYKESVPYINVRLVIKDRVDCAKTYMDLMQKTMNAEGIDCDTNLNLRGEIKGAINYYERDKIADVMLKSLDAKIISQNRESSNYTIYAYSPNIEQYTICCGDKINISINEAYDEIENTTIVYLSTPFCNLDY